MEMCSDYDINLYQNDLGDYRVCAYELYIDDRGDLNTTSQPVACLTLDQDQVNQLLENWGMDHDELYEVDEWDVNGGNMRLPESVLQWIEDLNPYELDKEQ